MMSKIKTYFEDYVVAQKACNEFNKKHWFGTMVLSLLVGVGTWGAFMAAYKIHDYVEEKKLIKKLQNEETEEQLEGRGTE